MIVHFQNDSVTMIDTVSIGVTQGLPIGLPGEISLSFCVSQGDLRRQQTGELIQPACMQQENGLLTTA